MSRNAKRGMRLFYKGRGGAACASCHSGVLQTDFDFHAIAMPQIGPGKGDGFDGHEDFGRGRETGDVRDLYRFRTPSLRNVALTAPYGHAGAYVDLWSVVAHHVDPTTSLYAYDPDEARLPSRADLDEIDVAVMSDPSRLAEIAAAADLTGMRYSKRDLEHIVEFLHALTDENSIDLLGDVPERVPSGLPVFD